MLAASLWPAILRSAGFAVGLPLLAAAVGCGGATAPCPTPPAALEAHRVQVEALQGDLSRVSDEIATLESRREEAARRIQEAKAVEDSLAQGAARPSAAGRTRRR